ncbi:hypothetical protein [Streptomyces sp. NPDC096033]|uniref:hypothetical protein n=1 Tax=Streptomyces sp. NPDC096033 TaxID=3366071 RepID=UPI0037FBA50B
MIGPVAVGYAFLGIAFGAVAGLLVGRTLPAMAAAVTATGALAATLVLVRPRLWPSLSGAKGDGSPWQLSGPADPGGPPYHPEAHFWPLQLVESGILLLVAAAATTAAFALLRRRQR